MVQGIPRARERGRLLLEGCGGQQDALAPKSHQSRDIASLFWWMTGAAFVGMGLIVFLLLLAWKRRHRRGIGSDTEGEKPGERFAWYVVVGAGIVLPIILLATLFVVSDIFVIRTTQAPAAASTRLTIEVVGHQWWWEVRYPGTEAVTANEIHIPVRTPVRVEVRSADVIHSFWVPELNRKIDAIPGQQNVVELYADVVGRYRGACAEFCGLQHTHMDMYVFAEPPAAFERWLANQAATAAAPATSLARRGEQVFTQRRVRQLPHGARHDRHAARSGPISRISRRARRSRPSRSRTPRASSPRGSPARSTSSPATRCRTSGCRPAAAGADRLPHGAEIVAIAEPRTAAVERLDRLERMWKGRPGVLGWLHDDRPQEDRAPLLLVDARLLRHRRHRGARDAHSARFARQHPRLAETYDQLFSLHGITMIFFFIIPMTTGGFGNYLIPLMIGARDMAFPRLNALTFWIFLGSGIFLYTSFALGMAPDAGWFDYVPLASRAYDPGRNIDFYCLGIIFNSLASTLTAGQFIVTILKYRAPGMSFNRMPLFVFAQLAAAFGLLFALPFLSADAIFLYLDRNIGTHFFDSAQGGSALLWQDLFWIFGHPEVYILIVPAFGIATTIIPTFTRRKMVAFPLVAIAELLVVFIGFGVWAHHMFATGLPTIALTFFAAATAMVVIPSTIQVFAWCMSFVLGTTSFTTPLLFIAGFIFMFVAGGLTGIMFLAVPFDQQVTDTYFVIAHFHYIIFGAAVFPIFGGMYFWFPKVTGKLYFERPGQISFWIIFVGTNLLFFPMHIVGLLGMPRRNYTYPSGLGWTAYNLAETIGGFVTLVGILVLLGNLVVSYRKGAPAGPDPWHAPTLEWTTSSPPPEYNFAVTPKVTSAYPNWDAEDRAEDGRNLERGVLVLDQGHEQASTSPVDANFSEVVALPHQSHYPIVLAFTLSLVFAALVAGSNGTALVMGVLCLLVLSGWHSQDPRSIDADTSADAAPLPDRRRRLLPRPRRGHSPGAVGCPPRGGA